LAGDADLSAQRRRPSDGPPHRDGSRARGTRTRPPPAAKRKTGRRPQSKTG
jgi:hypothetical protein